VLVYALKIIFFVGCNKEKEVTEVERGGKEGKRRRIATRKVWRKGHHGDEMGITS
jgi:hypothetical protein